MPQLTIRIPAPPIPRRHPKAYLQNEDGQRFTLPYAPRETEHGGDADDWAQLARSGRKPLVRRTGEGLRTLSFSFLISAPWGVSAVEGPIAQLRKVAGGEPMVLFSLGVLERGWWRVTDLTITPLMREEGTNRVTRATASLQLLEAFDVRPKIGRTATKPKPKPKGKGKSSTAGSSSYRYATVKRGDTLWDISVRMLGSGPRWREIARLNKISDPRKLKVGQRLRIPPR